MARGMRRADAEFAYRALVEYDDYAVPHSYGVYQTAGAARRAGGKSAPGRRVRIQRVALVWEDIPE